MVQISLIMFVRFHLFSLLPWPIEVHLDVKSNIVCHMQWNHLSPGVHKIIGATKHITNAFFMESSSLRLENFEIMKKSYVPTI
jgi:hypothetical protein